jgi:hypothetical protein
MASMKGGVRYDRASVDSTLAAARRLAAKSDTTMYAYATAYGMTLDTRPAPFGQQYYQITPDGGVEYVPLRLEREQGSQQGSH